MEAPTIASTWCQQPSWEAISTNLQRERVLRLETHRVTLAKVVLSPPTQKQQNKLNFDEMLRMVKVMQNVILICNIWVRNLVNALLKDFLITQPSGNYYFVNPNSEFCEESKNRT